ncbi:MAG: leucyl aminopeptidase [Burkholderiaceae bacterium]
MEFSTKAGTPDRIKSGCVVVGVYADKKLTPAASLIDAATNGALTRAGKSGDLPAKRGGTLMLSSVQGIAAERVLVVGLGKHDDLKPKGLAEAVRAAVKALDSTGAGNALFTLAEVPIANAGAVDNIKTLILAAREALFRSDGLKSEKEDAGSLTKIIIPDTNKTDGSAASSIKIAVAEGVALANGCELTKTLGNLQPNICTPSYLADTAKKMAKDWDLKVEVLERKQMEALKMGSLLSVARGSIEPPKLIVLIYSGGKAKDAPVVLVGKGITFDSGGISLKPGEAMDEMKYDMCGAGSVLGTIRAIAEMGLKLNVIGVIPTCENMPAGDAVKPGDIVTSMSGQTIEILNTDAEGRLILCDALTYSERFKPAAVIDIATLTGACVIALGHVNSGLFSNDDGLADELVAASKTANDPAWHMPLDDDYQESLKSNFADMANIGGRPGGSITAACFLSRYAKSYKWAHLDIAGTAWKSGPAKGATGRPVPLLAAFLKARAA